MPDTKTTDSYTRVNWVNGITPINQDNLNNMDSGIAQLFTVIGDVNKLGDDTIISSMTATSSKVDALETTVGNSSTGLVKDVSDLKTASTTHATKTELAAEKANLIGTSNDASYKDTIYAAKRYADTDVANPIKARIDTLETTVGNSSNGLIKDVNDIKDTLENFNPDVDLDDYYTKTEVDIALDDYCKKTDVNSVVNTSISNYVSSTEFENRLTEEVTDVTSSNYYTKDTIDSTFAKSSDVYTKDDTIGVDEEVILYCGNSLTNLFTN